MSAADLQSSFPDRGLLNRSVNPGSLPTSRRSRRRSKRRRKRPVVLLGGHSGQGHWVRLLRTSRVHTQLLTIILGKPHLVTDKFFLQNMFGHFST